MRVISLNDQLFFAKSCLEKMRKSGRDENEIALQESICFTLEDRIQEKVLKIADEAGI